MDKLERRKSLETIPDPEPRLDYLVTLCGSLKCVGPDRDIGIEVRYVPDRLILAVEAFGSYLSTIATTSWETPEALAAAVLDDINNETVARWVQVVATVNEPYPRGVEAHSVMLEDRQPRWDNPKLLSRLGPR